ncbi:MAG: response regulator, partial [Rhodopirellula sp.]|nr:response regulator [Rhodopirellula sp.]
HEIRTPMNAILGFTEVLRRGMYDDPTQQAEYLETIHSSGQHLLRLINDILDLSKVEAGRLEVERLPCCPHQLLLEVITVLKVKADEKQLRLECQTPGGLPEVIETDPGRVRQILTNVIGNALKFTDSGSVSVVAKMLWDTKTRLQIDVIDTGVGMSDEAMLKIFDPFSQADNSITRRFGGTGLGLTISKSFADSLGGDLTVASVAGEGSTFTIVIDAGQIDHETRVLDISEFAAEVKQVSATTRGKRYRFDGSRILLVDDGDSNRQLIQLLLQRNGLLVETAVNGQIAVDKATTSDYDVILMDMQMPVMDGYTATRKLREYGLDIPIVALTANAMRGDEEKCRDAGCTGFLTKPVDLDGLLNYLAELLEAEECEDESNIGRLDGEPLTPSIATAAVENSGATTSASATDASFVEIHNQVEAVPPANSALLDEVIDKVQPAAKFDPYDTANVFPSGLLAGSKPSTTPRKPIRSELPFGDAEFREIIIGFVEKLRSEVDELQKAWQRRDLEAVARIAHWLKGAAGTMGFREFTEPGLELMNLAHEEKNDQIDPVIREITEMVAAIELPELV